MGCLIVSTTESVLSQLKIRETKMSEFKNKFGSLKGRDEIISEVNYQELIYTYLTPGNDYCLLNDYWFEFYNSLTYSEKKCYIFFCLCLLCEYKPENFEDERDILCEILEKEFINRQKMIRILSTYVELISHMTIKHLKYLENDSERYEKEKKLEWDINAIEPFVIEKLFDEMDFKMEREFNLKDYLSNKKTMKKLRDDEEIRKDLANFSKVFHSKAENFTNTPDY